ncbi:hypothetical protein Leryth_000279, partial [Lithospermum erythrorhizon]
KSTVNSTNATKTSSPLCCHPFSSTPPPYLHHYNSFLYISTTILSDPTSSESTKTSAIEFGFKVYAHMVSSKVVPNHPFFLSLTNALRRKGDGDTAFELAKGVGKGGRLRTYGPALFCYCKNGEEEKGYDVEDHMGAVGLQVEEPELAALLKVSMEKGRELKVYEYLHKLRNSVRGVDESTAEIIQSWFGREEASGVGLDNWDKEQVKEANVKNGGGWHGTGWLGRGKWLVQKSNISSDGRCLSCSEQLFCVDTSREETEKFSQSVASLAKEREVEAHFTEFQDWLEGHLDYEAVVDGANVGLYQQNFADGGFSMTQLDAVVKETYNRSKKWPLIVLHNKRVRTLFEDADNREILEKWKEDGALYATPYGSNDDWYWLYAAVKLKCLLVTNDEMRDHIFELFGSRSFSTWKERHQVRYTFVKGNLKLILPPLYSTVIQESESGSWHVPLAGENSDESSRTWLCITRHGSSETSAKVSSIVSLHKCDDQTSASSEEAFNTNGVNGGSDAHISATTSLPVTGKRKDRSPIS